MLSYSLDISGSFMCNEVWRLRIICALIPHDANGSLHALLSICIVIWVKVGIKMKEWRIDPNYFRISERLKEDLGLNWEVWPTPLCKKKNHHLNLLKFKIKLLEIRTKLLINSEWMKSMTLHAQITRYHINE